MRSLIILFFLMFLAHIAMCQQERIHVSADSSAEMDDEDENAAYAAAFSRAEAQFERRNYALAEKRYRRAFALIHSEESARGIYYSLRYQGFDLEAEDFKKRHPGYAFAIQLQRRGLESIYVDAGPRISANNNADNIYYGDAGVFFRLSSRLRLWQSLGYLKQDHDLGHYKQYGYFASITAYLGKGWSLHPALHYDYVPYTFLTETKQNVSYQQSYNVGPGDTLIYKTNAIQNISTSSPGHTHFLNLALPLSKHLGFWVLAVEPAVHSIAGSGTVDVSYTSTGTTDSFRREHLQGTKPFHETGASSGDTSYRHTLIQMSAGLSYRLPIRGEPLALHAACYFVRDENGATAWAYYMSASYWRRTTFRIYASWLRKESLPLVLNTEGQYFNFNDPIQTRAGITFQLYPLKHWSPMLTYQYEQDLRLQDAAVLMYHSMYLTLKYTL